MLGTIVVLQLAAEQDLLHLPTSLAALQHTSFQCTQAIIEEALQLDIDRQRAGRNKSDA